MENPIKLQIFNSMSKQKEVFKPIEEGKVGMYVCGVTPYDLSHIGHARAYVSFDVLHRYLKYLGYEVKYVRIFTDIDDKIIKRANEKEPRVSHSMDQIKDMINKVLQQLKEKALKRAMITEEEVQQKIEERNLARRNKEYEKSDKIREDLYLKGISLMDEPKGTIWRPCELPEIKLQVNGQCIDSDIRSASNG